MINQGALDTIRWRPGYHYDCTGYDQCLVFVFPFHVPMSIEIKYWPIRFSYLQLTVPLFHFWEATICNIYPEERFERGKFGKNLYCRRIFIIMTTGKLLDIKSSVLAKLWRTKCLSQKFWSIGQTIIYLASIYPLWTSFKTRKMIYDCFLSEETSIPCTSSEHIICDVR